MADYHPLVSRAVAGLEANTGEARRSLYERARAALVQQLRSATPALSESDITRERLALEEAIRKVEAEEARRGRIERPPAASKPPLPPVATPPPAEPPPAEPPPAQSDAAPPPATPPAQPTAATQPEPQQPDTPDRGRSPSDDALSERSSAPAPAPDTPAETEPVTVSAAEAARLDEALRALRGRFTSSSSGAGEVVPRWPRAAPYDGRAAQPLDQADAPAVPQPPDRDFAEDDPLANNKEALRAERDIGAYPDPAAHDLPQRRSSGRFVKVVVALVVLAVLGALAAVGYRQSDNLAALYQQFRPAPPAPREQVKSQPKIEDRVGLTQPDRLPGAEQRGTGAPDVQPPPAVAQRVVLYEEDPKDPAGKRYVGSVIWRTETVSPGPGRAPELAVKANIEIPERRITMVFSMVRNTDPALPASHTVDIRFDLPPEFAGGGVANVPGILMKQAEQTRGVPLAGIAVKVTDNVFLIGLSSVDSDVQRNTQLLKERTWFDIPIVYNNGSRAILAVEKGTPGERAFNDAFTAWGRSGTAAR